MTRRRGDRTAQRRRRRERYRGCPVCGRPGGPSGGCSGCSEGASAVAEHGAGQLVLVVDGAFLPWGGQRDGGGPGAGGAGLVLALGGVRGTIVATQSCSFPARDSQDAEFQAVVRGARWAPGVPIHTDCETIRRALLASNPTLDLRFLASSSRHGAHRRADELAVEGRRLAVEAHAGQGSAPHDAADADEVTARLDAGR